MHEIQIGFQLYREVLGMTPELVEAIVKGIGYLFSGFVFATIIFCMFFGGPLLEHRREMKKTEVERIREERLLIEAKNASSKVA